MNGHRAFCSKNSGPVEDCHICNPKGHFYSESASAKGLVAVPGEDKFEWVCKECGQKGYYADIRKPIDRGVDWCPNCSLPVYELEY